MVELTKLSPQWVSRRRKGESSGSFRQTAQPLMRRAVKHQEMPHYLYMWDALAWLNLWDWNNLASANSGYEYFEPTDQNQHLSL
jgi:hypothetical protein